MRRLAVLLLVALACSSALAAGCTGIAFAKPAAAPVPPAQTGVPGPSLAGTWMMTWQGCGHDVPMTLVVMNNVVTGTYAYGGGTITGTIPGDRLIGTWTEDAGASKGPVEFVLSGDGEDILRLVGLRRRNL